MKVLHVTGAFYPATYFGGPIYSVYGLCNELAYLPEIDLRVLTTDSAGIGVGERITGLDFPTSYSAGYKVYFCRRTIPPSLSIGLLLRLWPMVQWADVVHLTGVYSSPTIPTLLVCRLLGKPVVWSPRGSLQRWDKASKLYFKWAWERCCNALLKKEKCILHVTSDKESIDSQERNIKAEVRVIPNGVDTPCLNPKRDWIPDGQLRLLFLGRLHPIKGIESLLHAVCLLGVDFLSLTIVGTGDGDYVSKLKVIASELDIEHQVFFWGHLEGEEKTQAFLKSDVCVVPSFSENFCMVVAEALAHGVPVIASRGTPWAEIEKRGCGLWVDNSSESLANAIKQINNMDLKVMGDRGKSWMEEKFSWQSIALQISSVYHSQHHG